MLTKDKIQAVLIVLAALILLIQLTGVASHAEGARKYQYKVISVTGMTELKTQSNTDQNRVVTIEKIIQEQSDGGWELYQADGYLLYFRR